MFFGDSSLFKNEKFKNEKIEFYWKQMEQIRFGLKNNIDISSYLNPDIDWEEMRRIRLKLKDKK